MKRISILLAVCVALIAVYVLAQYFSTSTTFVQPTNFHASDWKSDKLDHFQLAFPSGTTLELKQVDSKWQVNGFPADASHVKEVTDAFDSVQITSRASTNPDHQASFEVDSKKGVTLTLYHGDQQVQQAIIGKTAGGNSVYMRLPDQNDVYVMDGLDRYLLSDDITVWRDHAVADFASDHIRQIAYAATVDNWKLIQDKDGWTLSTNRIGPMSMDKDKTNTFLQSLTALQAVDFATSDQVKQAQAKKAAFATAIIEIGTVDTFERRETWSLFVADQSDRYLLVRDSDHLGFFVNKETTDQVLIDFPAMRTKLMPGNTAATAPSTTIPASK